MKKQETLKLLEQASENLQKAKMLLTEINAQDGEQFDYCTSAILANLTDEIMILSKAINKIVYQD